MIENFVWIVKKQVCPDPVSSVIYESIRYYLAGRLLLGKCSKELISLRSTKIWGISTGQIFCLFVLRQRLILKPTLASNLQQSSCLLSAEITGIRLMLVLDFLLRIYMFSYELKSLGAYILHHINFKNSNISQCIVLVKF